MTIVTNFYKGDTLDINFVNPDTSDLDISGKDIVITFKKKRTDTDELAYFQSRVTVPTDADSVLGIHNYQISSEDSVLVEKGNVFYDVRLIDTTPDPVIVTTIENDRIFVTENISDLYDPLWEPPFTTGYKIIESINEELDSTSWQSASGTPLEIKVSYESNADTNAFTDALLAKLNGIEAAAEVNQTPAELLAALITVDGTGSGLDADLFDGQESSYFAPQATTYTKVESDAITDLLAPQATTYTKVEVDNIADAVINGIDRKESVATFADIATTYPSPDEGWTVAVNDEDAFYMYTQGGWINIANATVPLASAIVDGKMSAADFILFHDLTDASRNIDVESIEFPNATSAVKPFVGYFGDILRFKSGNDGASSIWLQGEQTSFRDGDGVEYLYTGYDNAYTNFTGSADKAIRFASDITDANAASAGLVVDNQNATTKDVVSFRVEGTEVASISNTGDLSVDEIQMKNGVTLDNYASNIMDVKLGSTTYYRFNTSVAFELSSGNQITWGAGHADAAQDAGIKRQALGIVQATNASSGYGKFSAHQYGTDASVGSGYWLAGVGSASSSACWWKLLGSAEAEMQGRLKLQFVTDDFVIKNHTSSNTVSLNAVAADTLEVQGDFLFSKPLINISAAHTAVSTNHVINCTANTFSVTLPTAVGIQGKEYIIKNSGAGTITVDGDGSETIDGNITVALAQYDSATVISDGTNWIQI